MKSLIENKEISIEIQRLQSLFSTIQQASGIGIWELNLNTSNVYWSDKVYEIHEVPKATEIALDDGIKYYHPDYQPIIKSAVQDAIENGKSWDLELILVTAKKNEVWVRAIGWPIRENEKTIRLGGLFQDISRQKRDEFLIKQLNQKLKEKFADKNKNHNGVEKSTSKLKFSEERMSAIVNTAAYSIVIINELGKIQFVNPALEDKFGYTSNEIIGQNVNVLMPHPYKKQHDGYIKNYKRTGEKKIIGIGREVSAIKKNGEVFPIDLTISEFHEEGKKMFAGIMIDVSQRKNNEHILHQQSNELAAANKELETFCYSVSHDLRAPLRSIQGFSQALLEDCPDQLDEIGTSHLNRVSVAAVRMNTLIEDLLMLSKISREKLRAQVVDISELSTSIVKELNLPEKYSITIGNELTTVGDPKLIKILLTNLIENAVKYSSKIDSPLIEINESVENEQKWFWVKDNGAGFDMNYADKLFGAFQRLHSKTEFAGSGVGLATVQRIINKHGGMIRAYSEPDQGATFYFTLNYKPQL